MSDQPFKVQRASMAALFIEMISEGQPIASGTGFLYRVGSRDFLITARHCLTGKYANGEFISEKVRYQPSQVRVHFRDGNGVLIVHQFELCDKEFDALWLEHPRLGARADVVAMPLPQLSETLRGHWRSQLRHPMQVTDDVNIIGYPFGMKAGANLPIWARGTIATEPDVPYDDLPAFLVDSRTRTGQSGSPVVLHYRPGMMVPQAGPEISLGMMTGPVTRLIGIYTGRVNPQSDLGLVWHTSVIDEICGQAA